MPLFMAGGAQTTAGVAQEAIGTSVVTPALHYRIRVSDVSFSAAAIATFAVQENIAGAGWADIWSITVAANAAGVFTFGRPLVSPSNAVGNAAGTTQYRLAVTTPGGAAAVTNYYTGYTEK